MRSSISSKKIDPLRFSQVFTNVKLQVSMNFYVVFIVGVTIFSFILAVCIVMQSGSLFAVL